MLFLNLLVTVVVVLVVDDRILALKIMTGSTVASALGILLIRFFIFVKANAILSHVRELGYQTWPGVFRSVYRDYLKRYTLPMQLTGLFWYFTENLAIFIFARMGLMREAGIYSLVSRIYGVPRKFIPQMISTVFPRLVVSRQRDEAAFRLKYVRLSWGKLAAHAVFGTALLAGYPLIIKLAGLTHSGTLVFLFTAFSFNLVLHALVISNSNLILLSTDARWVLVTTGLRALVVAGVTIALIRPYQAAGAAIALVVSTLFTLAMYIFENRRDGVLTFGMNARQIGATFLLFGVWLIVIKLTGIW